VLLKIREPRTELVNQGSYGDIPSGRQGYGRMLRPEGEMVNGVAQNEVDPLFFLPSKYPSESPVA
jgi:hypothetical protein